MTGNKQWKKGYSVRLEQKSQKSFKKICSANFLERFLRFLFKTYQLSLFPLFIPGHPSLPWRLLLLEQSKARQASLARQARQARQAQARPSQGKAQQASQKSAACRQPPGPRVQGCASRARNPKGPQTHTFLSPIGSPSNRFARY